MDPWLPQAAPGLHAATALHPPLALLDPEPTLGPGLVRAWRRPRELRAPGRRHAARHLGRRAGQDAQRLPPSAPGGPGRRGGRGAALVMEAAAGGGAQTQEPEPGRHAQPLVPRGVPGLAPLTGVRCRRGLGADEPPCRPVLGTRGEVGGAAGALAPGAASAEALQLVKSHAGEIGSVPLACG
jgi:hypothetical protein